MFPSGPFPASAIPILLFARERSVRGKGLAGEGSLGRSVPSRTVISFRNSCVLSDRGPHGGWLSRVRAGMFAGVLALLARGPASGGARLARASELLHARGQNL